MSLQLVIQPAGLLGTNAYLVLAPARGEAVLIDAPRGVWAQLAPALTAAGCRLTELWLTHGHWDHMDGAAEVVRATGAKVSAHRADEPLLANPGMMGRFMGLDLTFEPLAVDTWIDEGTRLVALGHEIEVRHVPGHCPGNVLFYFAPEPDDGAPDWLRTGAAFTGDVLLGGGTGRTDLPGGDARQLARSIRERVYTLPRDTVIFPGHFQPSTVGHEMAHNRHVAALA